MSPLPAPSPSSTPNPATLILHSAWHGVWQAVTSSPIFAISLGLIVVVASVKVVRAIVVGPAHLDPVRRFGRADRAAIMARAGGRCEYHGWLFGRCRATDNLHADHLRPHSKGGTTTPANGQALCARHNRKKGARMPSKSEMRALNQRRAAYRPSVHPEVPGQLTLPMDINRRAD